MSRITFLIAVMMLAVSPAFAQKPTAKRADAPPSTDAAGPEKTFTDPAMGVTCAYPADWKVVDPASSGEHVIFCAKPSTGPLAAPAAHIQLSIAGRARNRATDGEDAISAENEKFLLSFLAARKQALDHFELIDAKSTRVAGASAVRVDGAYTAAGEQDVHTRDVLVAHADSIITFSMSCRAADFDANRARLARLLATVKLAKPDPKMAKAPASQPASRPAGNNRDASFISTENHFKFSYPARWQPAPNAAKSVFTAMLDGDKGTRSMLSVMINELPPHDPHLRPIERATRWIIEDAQQTALRNVQQPVEIEVDGRPMMRFSADVIQGGVKCRAVFLVAVEFDHTIAVMVSAPIPREAEVKATADQITRTWRWIS